MQLIEGGEIISREGIQVLAGVLEGREDSFAKGWAAVLPIDRRCFVWHRSSSFPRRWGEP
jgi:hypothetical protein